MRVGAARNLPRTGAHRSGAAGHVINATGHVIGAVGHVINVVGHVISGDEGWIRYHDVIRYVGVPRISLEAIS